MRQLAKIPERKWARMFCAEALTEQDGKCRYCHAPLTCRTATADHKRPRIFGGETSRANIAAACEGCNKTKGSLTPHEFLRLIKDPHGHDLHVWMAWSRRRIWLATERSCNRIMRMAA